MLAAGLCPPIAPARRRSDGNQAKFSVEQACPQPAVPGEPRGRPAPPEQPSRRVQGCPTPRSGYPRPRPAVLTWSPPHRPFPAAAEAHFAEDAQDVPLTEGAPVLARAGAALGGGHPVAVGLPRLPLLPDQRAGDSRCHRHSWAPHAAPRRSGGRRPGALRPSRRRAPRGRGRGHPA